MVWRKKKHAAPQAHGTKVVNPIKPPVHQVCFKAVDDHDKPLASIEFQVQGGTKKKKLTGKTGAKGRILFNNLSGGGIKVLALAGETMYELVNRTTVDDIPPDADTEGSGSSEIKVRTARDTAKKYAIQADDTLAGVAKSEKKDKDLGLTDWNDLALYNWGTDVNDEVNRALLECIGCSEVKDDPAKTVLAPPQGETREILIPKCCASAELGENLALDKMHVFKLKPILPANAVSPVKSFNDVTETGLGWVI
ncbi:MAG: hypothetical protein ABSH05_27285 [Bryobacteraceae bacterium]|jgi:hypothetical protein